jgi:hypothetical protein
MKILGKKAKVLTFGFATLIGIIGCHGSKGVINCEKSPRVTDAQGTFKDPDWPNVSYLADRDSVNSALNSQAQKGFFHDLTVFNYCFFTSYTKDGKPSAPKPSANLNDWGIKKIREIVKKLPEEGGTIYVQNSSDVKADGEGETDDILKVIDNTNKLNTERLKAVDKYLSLAFSDKNFKVAIIDIDPYLINNNEASNAYKSMMGKVSGGLDNSWLNPVGAIIGGNNPAANSSGGNPSGGDINSNQANSPKQPAQQTGTQQ